MFNAGVDVVSPTLAYRSFPNK